ncbi:tyrosine-type recombinase/integrase [Rhodococcus erythropolis]|uniref:tyrosine-type recombinase/integrase n=1 Tax=Rhodococcus erythropolis TaxID=1833 RepID=UPI002948CBDD|nr:tyrosine-type recombinase/integrase [Rhodococcus erythropolis]MDV6275871.1 tyrosine-type recombinase/integrase [Rhodococcus erythropolis]
MATIKSYDTKAGLRYKVRYMKPDGTQGSKGGFPSKPAAESFANRIEVRKLDGEFVDPKHGRLTVESLAQPWLDTKKAKLKASAYKPLESAWRVHVKPEWGTVRIADIEVTMVEDWITDLVTDQRDPANPEVIIKRAASATTVIRAHAVLSGLLDRAVRDRKILANKARDVDNLPRKVAKRKIYLTHTQVALLADSAGEWSTLVLFLAYCGLRWGEAIGLQVGDLDLLRRRVSVNRNAVEVGSEIVVGTPKSNKPRSIPIPAFLVDELSKQCIGKGRESLVFSGPDGDFMRRPKTPRGWFIRAVEAAELPTITPHDLRHTAASLAISAGANVKAVQRMLGHESAALTLDVYAELFDDDLDTVASALDRARLAVINS